MSDADVADAKIPAHEIVYRQLREMILFGDLAPGQSVTIQGLVAATDSGMTPVREAIRRLCAEHALTALGNRRITVPELTPADLDQIAFARNAIEPELAMRALDHITAAQIDLLEQVDAELDAAICSGDVQAYLRLNHAFHHQIYELAAAPILSDMAQALWLRVGPSLRVICGRRGTDNLPDMHEEAIAALRAGDAPALGAAIRADIAQGHGHILRSFTTS